MLDQNRNGQKVTALDIWCEAVRRHMTNKDVHIRVPNGGVHCHGAHEGSANEVILPALMHQRHTESFNDLRLIDTHTYTQTKAEACLIATITLV